MAPSKDKLGQAFVGYHTRAVISQFHKKVNLNPKYKNKLLSWHFTCHQYITSDNYIVLCMYILTYPLYLWPTDCKHLDEIDVFFICSHQPPYSGLDS